MSDKKSKSTGVYGSPRKGGNGLRGGGSGLHEKAEILIQT